MKTDRNAEITTLRAEVERLTREREDYREKRANESENLRTDLATAGKRICELTGRVAEVERLWADDVEMLKDDIRRRDAMIASLRAAATTIVEKWNVGRFPHREEWDALRAALSGAAQPSPGAVRTWAQRVADVEARDATCSCACANHPSGGCGCPCLRHPREGTW
jgi:hypothetical protein